MIYDKRKTFLTLILMFLTIIILFNINEKKKDVNIQENMEKEDDKTISKEENNKKEESSDVIMSISEIEKYNKEISSKTNTLFDIFSISQISANEIKSYVNSYKVPNLPKYNGDKKINKNELDIILNNRNIENIKDQKQIVRGLIVERSNLRSFPTEIHFYDNPNINYLDRIQETELLVNTPVLILHESKDKLWYFVLAPNYYGWIKKDTIAQATVDDWDYFLNNDNFVVITNSQIKIADTTLDMSVKVPYISDNDDTYEVVLPKKNNDYVTREIVTIEKEDANIGYLSYTKENIYKQALKYENTPYQWGGFTGGIDCSGYIANVFRSFGFQFPRNTKDQNSSIGQVISLSNKSNKQKLELIEKYPTALLYQSGHVMLYLGKKDNNHYIIHANGTTLNVAITVLEGSKYLDNINKIVLVTNK